MQNMTKQSNYIKNLRDSITKGDEGKCADLSNFGN